MESEKRGKGYFMCFLLVGLFSQSLVTPVMCRRSIQEFNDQKNYYSTPDPHVGSAPKPEHKKPGCSPSHGGTKTPSQGSGRYHNTPPSYGSHSPPAIITPPSTPVIAPVIPTPTTPVISTPPSPLFPDPNTPPSSPGTCKYWSTHPDAIFAIFGYMGTIGESFGAACGLAFGKNPTIHDALTNTRTDGMGDLFREGTAALLNSIACKKFAFTTHQVKDAFAAAIGSDKAAAAQALLFKKANMGLLKF